VCAASYGFSLDRQQRITSEVMSVASINVNEHFQSVAGQLMKMRRALFPMTAWHDMTVPEANSWFKLLPADFMTWADVMRYHFCALEALLGTECRIDVVPEMVRQKSGVPVYIDKWQQQHERQMAYAVELVKQRVKLHTEEKPMV
jgi:hypothetical protein